MDSESTSYVLQSIYNISEEINEEIILKTLELLSRKHDVLRTIIMHEKMSQPRQVVLKKREIEYEKIDLTHLIESEQNEKISEIAKLDVGRGFNLQKESLMRMKYIDLNNASGKLIWSMHHIIMDGWCLSILFGDFKRYYEQLRSGKSMSEMERIVDDEKRETADYGEYIKWLEKQDKEEGLTYWNDLLADYDEVAEIKPMKSIKSVEEQVDQLTASISEETSKRLMQIAASNNVTVNNIMEAAWGIVLQKYNSTDDVVFGKVVSGRNVDLKNIEKMVGLFINTVPLRVACRENTTVIELLKAVQQQSIDGNSYDYCSLADIQSQTQQKSDLIKTLFVFENYYVDEKDIKSGEKGFQAEFESAREQTNYGISLSAYIHNEQINCKLSYNPREYDKDEIETIHKRIEKVLLQIVEKPEMKVSDINVITEEEKELIVHAFNDTKTEYPKDKTVVELFEEQVEKTPDNIAVVFEDEKLTYAELNRKANQLARKLRKLGVKPDDFVAIMAERSMEMIVGIYGIIKAGGAYVPIDPTYPVERINYMIEDCAPKAIVVYKAVVETELSVVDLSDNKVWEESSANLDRVNTTSDLIYCIYTSGTTGKPKGVMIEHKSVINLCTGLINKIYCNSLVKKVALLAAYVFDASIQNIFAPLISGRSLYVISESIRLDFDKLLDYININNIDAIDGTPTHLKIFKDELHKLKKLKVALIGGEKLESNIVNLFNRYTKIDIYNVYGPTEATVDSTSFKCIGTSMSNIPIGKPISNTHIFILNAHHLCGVGVPGELCIAGDGIARGYLNRPELTKEKFVDNPYGDGKMYRTGDLARWLPDGNIEYLGRIDDQVKIRGFRIELGEIESELLKVDKVKDAAVIAKEDDNGDKAISAYIVSDEEISVGDLRNTLGKTLPEYMIPSYIMQIEMIPVTRNGKIDKRALPEIEAKSEREYIAPRNEIEEKVAGVFEEILGVEMVGVKDSFFELGGHSLRATRTINRIEAETGVRLPLNTMFANPTVEGLSHLVKAESGEEYIPIPKAEEKEFYPMSSTQKRMYLINHMDRGATAYNIPQSLRLRGEVRIEAIKETVQKLINRHEILRTDFLMIEEELVQKVRENVNVDFEYAEDTKTAESELLSAFTKPFNLEKAPLLRVRLVNRGDHHLLLIDMHHIVSDGMSMGTFIQEFGLLYNEEKLDELTHQYKDYSEWMRTRDISSQKEYWMDEFSDEIPVLDMPIDYARPQEQSFKGALVFGTIEEDLSEQLRKLAGRTGATEYMVLLSALMVTLSKYSRQEDIVVGSPISGRTHKDTEHMLGMFINTLAMRGRPEGNKQYNEFLDEVKESCIKAYENQEYPFEELVEAVDVRRDMSRNPLFDVMLVLQNNEEAKFALKDIDTEYVKHNGTIEKFDLTFNIFNKEGQFRIGLGYCTDLFKEENAQRILSHYIRVLEQIANNCESKINEIEVVTEEERALIIHNFNDTTAEYPKDKTVVDLFEEQVEKTPDNIAVVFEDEKLTYAELNSKANQLARKLRKLGVKPDDFVAIMTERSIEMIVGIYGIIKAGGAYVPIDPTYPVDRIKYMIEDCAPKAIVVYKAGLETGLSVVDLSENKVWEESSTNLDRVNNPSDLAYCIYTSGTTGKPKGVMIEHKSVINLCTGLINKIYSNSLVKKVALLTTYVFDGSIKNIFAPLVSGRSLYVINESIRLDFGKLLDYININSIDAIDGTPTHLKIFKDELHKLNKLKVALIGGEKLDSNIVDLFNRYSKIDIYNVYGPTEATVDSTSYKCVGTSISNIPIGKPISNMHVYILNEKSLCGVGVPGELCIAGDGIARGYLNRPELTKEKFVDNPYGEGKMYRTGDLARWLPDGNIEYLGRFDDQVKIRGFRIELGEIESELLKVDKVKDAVVIAKEDDNGDKAISAYIVSDEEISVGDLRNTLGNTLPEYMIPSYMMQIENIPVTRNGKIDKRALPKIETKSESEYIAPRNEIEEKVACVFEEILNVEKVGVKDSFFELGGHSLRAMRTINRIEAETGVRLPLKTIFANPTVEGLSNLVKAESGEEYIPIPKAEGKEFYPMSSTQKRMYLINQIDCDGTAYNMAQGLRLRGEVRVEAIQDTVQKIINRHEILRTDFLMIEGELVQKIRENVTVNLENVEDVITAESELLSEFTKPFNLENAPLLRVKLVERTDHHLLLIDMHHIISDGMSMGIFIQEFGLLYNEEKLDDLTHQYIDYSEWMRIRDISSQKEYWVNEFSDEIPVLDMPIDYARPKEQSFKGALVFGTIEEDLSEQLRKLASRTGATEYMILLSALMVTLSKYSRQEDIVVGSPISGRTHKDTERMLGMFINTLAMRGCPEGNKQYNEFLDEVKESCLKAYENQEYPFEELVEAVEVRRDMSRNPLFDVMLVLQNNEDARFALKDIDIEYLKHNITIEKFDLTFNIYNQEGQFRIGLGYCTDLFKEESAQRILSHYIRVLEQIANNCESKINEIEVVTAEERALIIHSFNDTAEEYPKGKTMVELFEEQVEKTPDNIAVLFKDEKLTYAELNRKANQLARKLRRHGVKPDDFVVIMAERSIEMIVGIYGIVKAGGAYVPIDPMYPVDRINYMLEDCAPKAVVAYKAGVEKELPVIDLGDNKIWEEVSTNLCKVNKPSDLAYCIYTSGTTGKPKGVMVEHKGIPNMINYFKNKIAVSENDTILQFANIAFDTSVWETTMAILVGGSLAIVPESIKLDIKELVRYAQEQNVTVATLPPNYYMQTNDFEPETIITAGSKSTADLVEKVKNSRYINSYGPTETTVCATHWECMDVENMPTNIPIGKPISNTHIYILNAHSLCGVGVPGELCIAGDGIARGYLNRPELTKEKFVDNPYGEGKMYRTGDLARWLPDGNIEFLGRFDDQVKIRGFRIELGEIEYELLKVDNVKDAVVIAKEDDNGDKAISAYVVSDEELSVSDLRNMLGNTLPEYMIPSYMMQIDKIPVTRNGKIDKRALPKIETKSESEYIAPRNEIEEKVACVFEEILNVEQVGVKDKFFELGGDSIKAIRVVSKIREAGYDVSVKDILQKYTVEAIADSAVLAVAREYEQNEVTGTVITTPIFESFESWKFEKPHHFNQSMMIKVETSDEKILKTALNALVKHHDVLRSVYRNKTLEILSMSESKKYDFTVFDFTGEVDLGEKIERECTKQQSSINLENGPLMKAVLFNVENGSYMMICLHHLVVDGVSWRILLEDLNTVLRQLKEKNEILLPSKTASFKEWGEALTEYKNSKTFNAEKEYWEGIIAEMRDGVIDKIDNGAESGHRSANIVFSKKETEDLVYNAGKAFSTEINDLLLSAVGMSFKRLFEHEKVVVGLEGHGREEIHKKIDIDRTVGWFTSVYPIVIKCKDGIQESIISVKDMLRNVPNHGMGYGLLKNEYQEMKANLYFNYLGEMEVSDKDDDVISYSTGKNIAKENKRVGAININGSIRYGQLSFVVMYDQCKYSDETIEKFAKLYKNSLNEIVEYCINQDETIVTVSDYSASDLSNEDLEMMEMLF